MKEYTWEELKATGWDDADQGILLAIRDDVYRIDPKFTNIHPGGQSTLRLGEGRDCSLLFESYHNTKGKGFEHFIKSHGLGGDMIKKVGILKTTEFPKAPPAHEFHQALKDRVAKKLKEQPIDARYTHLGMQGLRLAWLWGGIFGGFYVAMFMPGVPLIFRCLAMCVSGMHKAFMGFHTMHDCSHLACTKYDRISNAVGHLCNTFISGHSFLSWQHQHVIGHHLYCNVKGIDPDVSGDALRFSLFHDWHPHHATQWLWAPFAYSILSWYHRVEDVRFFLEGAWGRIWCRRLYFSDYAIYFGGSAICLAWQLYLPVYLGVCSFWWALFMMNIGEAMGSFTASTAFIVSHVADGIHMSSIENLNKQGELEFDWAKLQCITTQDYGEGSFFAFWLSGGLNFQTVHHLLPGISLMHYPFIQPTVKQVCKEFGYPYNHKDTFWDAFVAHYKLLHFMGVNDKTAAKLA